MRKLIAVASLTLLAGCGSAKVVNSGDKFVILKHDWGVCSTIPAPGQPVHGTVQLFVGHFTCGGGL